MKMIVSAIALIGGLTITPIIVNSQPVAAINSSSELKHLGSPMNQSTTSSWQPTGLNPYSVSCVSTTFCMAVGGNSNLDPTPVYEFNGESWTATDDPSLSALEVSCVSTTFCMATNPYDGDFSIFTGITWLTIFGLYYQITDLSCATSTFCVGVFDGFSGVFVVTYNGTGWSTPTAIESSLPGLYIGVGSVNISCTSSTFCMGADAAGNVFIFNGTSWTLESPGGGPPRPTNSLPTGDFGSVSAFPVSCPQTGMCVVGSGSGYSYIYGSWKPLPNIGVGVLSLSCPSLSFCLASTLSQGLGLAVFDGTTWHPSDLVNSNNDSNAFQYVNCVDSQFCFASSVNEMYMYQGSLIPLTFRASVVGLVASNSGNGYWEVASDGEVASFGSTPYLGSMASKALNAPIVGMAATNDGGGYWLVAADGGIFAFGDARFYGSMASKALNAPVVGMDATNDGGGYWLVAADGGIFNFGDSAIYGYGVGLGSGFRVENSSFPGQLSLSQPIVAIVPTSDHKGFIGIIGTHFGISVEGGLIFYGDAIPELNAAASSSVDFFTFLGDSIDSSVVGPSPIGGAPTADGKGYWLCDPNGFASPIGDAIPYGPDS